MTCKLKNTCDNKYLCCHFCKEHCDVRCKDDHKHCSWFDERKQLQHVKTLFTFHKDSNGNYKKRYLTLAEFVTAKRARLRA